MSDNSPFEPVLEATLRHALSYLDELSDAPVGPQVGREVLLGRLNKPLLDEGRDPKEVIDCLVKDCRDGLMDSSGARFFAWVIGGSVPASLAADWLTSTWDQNAGMYSVAPAAAVVEEVLGRWLLDLLRLPESASFALVTGCQMAHVTCLAAARNGVLSRVGWDVEEQGLMGAPKIRVITGDQRHGTIERALRMLGMGRQCIVDLPVEEDGRLSAQALEQALAEEPSVPSIVLLQAGDINTGSFDSFEELILIAHRHQAWVHVDGAFGLWANACSEYQHLAQGVEQADSWATDGHKWLNVPYDCGYAFVADRDAHYRSFSHRASYLSHSNEARDQVDWNPEYSRRGRGFASYAAISSLGRDGIAELISRCCRFAKRIVVEAAQAPGVEAAHIPTLNQGLLRFLDPREGATAEDHDRRTEEVTQRIVNSGEAFFACTTWRGKRCMRVSVCGWQTDDASVTQAVAAIHKSVGGV
jgi:glutamate/tyrosine decarboxylase-like PLP-dependent enzyme